MALAVHAGRVGWIWSPWSGEKYRLPGLALHACLAQAWVPSQLRTWNIPAWSVSAEWAAYLVFPLACAWIARVRTAWLALLGAAAASAALPLTLHVTRLGPTVAAEPTSGWIRIVPEFIAGALLCRARAALAGCALPWGPVALAAAVAIVAAGCTGLADPWAVPLFGVLILALSHDGALARCLSRRLPTLGGRTSYSLYLVHLPVFAALRGVLPAAGDPSLGALAGPAVVAAWAVTPFVCAWGVWRAVEEPCRAAVRAWAARRRA